MQFASTFHVIIVAEPRIGRQRTSAEAGGNTARVAWEIRAKQRRYKCSTERHKGVASPVPSATSPHSKRPLRSNMHLMYYTDANGKRVYTLKVRRTHTKKIGASLSLPSPRTRHSLLTRLRCTHRA